MHLSSFTQRALVAAIALPGLSAGAADISWDGNGDGTSWNDPVNWLGNVMPTSADTARIGNLAGIENDWLGLNQNDTLGGLEITDGMRLDTNGYTLTVLGNTLVSGENGPINNVVYPSTLVIDRGAGSDDFDTDNLTVTNEGSVRLINGGILEVDNLLTVNSASRVRGGGVIDLVRGSGTVYVNNGYLDPTTDGMTINAFGTGLIDLDGTSGNGWVQASARKSDGSAFDHITINGTGLTDAFDGQMDLTANGFIDMNLANGWTLGSGGTISLGGNSTHPGATEVRGGDVTVLGTVDVQFGPAHGRFVANVAADNGAVFNVGEDDILEFDGATNSFEGATFNLAEGAFVEFNNNTTVDSVAFNFDNPDDGEVWFDGPTTYSYQTAITSNGLLRQNGDATVVGSMTVNGGRFDLDGYSGNSTISLGNFTNNGSLTLNVESLDENDNFFDGTINTGEAGLVGGLTVNLPGNDAWTMAGTLNLVGGNNFFNPTRIDGSKMIVTDTINLVDNRPANIAADMDITSSATINTAAVGRMSVSGNTHVASGATFNGTGSLRNTGVLQLADGVDTSDVALDNRGTLAIGNSPGTATVASYSQTGVGKWEVEIGGNDPGTGHDRLNVAGDAVLDGRIDLSVINGFDPGLYQPLTVLSSFNRTGKFSTVGGINYAPGLGLAVTYTDTDALVTAALLGDIDFDGDVDDADYGLMFAGFTGPMGEDGGSCWVHGDIDGDGDTDDADFGILFALYTGPITTPPVDPPVAGDFDLADDITRLPEVLTLVNLPEADLSVLRDQLGITPRAVVAQERIEKVQARALYNDLSPTFDHSANPDGSYSVANSRLDSDVVREALQLYNDRLAVEGLAPAGRTAQIKSAMDQAFSEYASPGEGFDADHFVEYMQRDHPALLADLGALEALREITLRMGLSEREKTNSESVIINRVKPAGLTYEQMKATLESAGSFSLAEQATTDAG